MPETLELPLDMAMQLEALRERTGHTSALATLFWLVRAENERLDRLEREAKR